MYEDMKVFMGSSNGKNTKQTKLKMGMRSVHILPCASCLIAVLFWRTLKSHVISLRPLLSVTLPQAGHVVYSPQLFSRRSLVHCFVCIFGPAWQNWSTRAETLKPFELNSVRRLFSQGPLKIDGFNYCNSNFSNVSTFGKSKFCLPFLIEVSCFPPKEQREAGIFSLSKKIACIFLRQIVDQRHL